MIIQITTLLAGGKLVDSYDGGFSSTTTATFSTNMYIGYEDTAATVGDAVVTAYDQPNTFTGEDSPNDMVTLVFLVLMNLVVTNSATDVDYSS